ncbi:hypothetical protein LXL04_034461 [Taraxacum kok-saghyz]
MFVSWQKWTASFVPLGFIPDSKVIDQLEAKNIYLQGLCKDEFPVVIGTRIPLQMIWGWILQIPVQKPSDGKPPMAIFEMSPATDDGFSDVSCRHG